VCLHRLTCFRFDISPYSLFNVPATARKQKEGLVIYTKPSWSHHL
jgi:hypothetical protein